MFLGLSSAFSESTRTHSPPSGSRSRPAKSPVCAEEVDHQLHRVAGVPMAWCRTLVRGVVSEATQPSQPVDRNGELKSGVLGNRDVVAERRPLADALSLRRRQLVRHATDVPAERDLKCGSGVDDRAPVGVASVRRSCVTAQNFFEGWLLAITDKPENVSPFLSAKWADVRRSNRDAYSAVVGWLDDVSPTPTNSAS